MPDDTAQNIVDPDYGTWFKCRTCGHVGQVVAPEEIPMDALAFAKRLQLAQCPSCPTNKQKLVVATRADIENGTENHADAES